jgi:hypothetical protein
VDDVLDVLDAVAALFAEDAPDPGPPLRPTTLYRFFGDGRRLLYVGITSTGLARWAQHARDKGWWTQVTYVEVRHFDTREEAEEAEITAIRSEDPAYNIAGREPPAVPAPGRKRAVNFMVDPALLAEIDVAADHAGQSRSVWLARGAEAYLAPTPLETR